jgi:hypothetical protein
MLERQINFGLKAMRWFRMAAHEKKETEAGPTSTVPSSIVLIGLALSLCFIFLLLVIVNSAADAKTAAADESRPFWMFFTRRSFFVYETVLAGMLGAYLGEIFQIGGLKTEAELRAYGQRFFVALFLGGAAAIVVGVLFPLVVLGEFEGNKINSWTLVAAAGIAGNRARDAFSQVDAVLARLLANFEPNIDGTAISKSVKVGVQEAFAIPPPVQYVGLAAANVFRNNESVLTVEGEARSARLEHGADFELRVNFVPSPSALGTSFRGISKPVAIREGESQPVVSFRLLVDFGFIALPLEERAVAVPANAASTVETFKFSVPFLEETSASVADSSVPSRQREISVSIYQHTRYFDTIIIPVDMPT